MRKKKKKKKKNWKTLKIEKFLSDKQNIILINPSKF